LTNAGDRRELRVSRQVAAAAVFIAKVTRRHIPLDNSRYHDYRARAVAGTVARELKQKRAFTSTEQEVLLGLRIAAARIMEPWEKFLKVTAELTPNQYNVLRIVRGSHPTRLPCGDIAERMISRDPDITRLVDRLSRRGLVTRGRGRRDRRVVEVAITENGLQLLRNLDPHVDRFPRGMLGHLGPKKLEQLRALLEQVIADLGTFP
jgi:DNA-binding MarR family transcriptional regulator